MSNIESLVAGYRRFRDGNWQRERARWAELAEGQSPGVMVIACSDSRVDPSQIFDVAPGEIFVVRNISALVPPYEEGGGRHGVSAALEFAVTQLEVKDVVVMGHGLCGGVAAALTRRFEGAGPGEGGFIAHWVDMLDEARDRVLANGGDPTSRDVQRALEEEAVKVSLANLRTFPFIPERERAGTLRLHGTRFAISHGRLELLDETSGQFHAA